MHQVDNIFPRDQIYNAGMKFRAKYRVNILNLICLVLMRTDNGANESNNVILAPPFIWMKPSCQAKNGCAAGPSQVTLGPQPAALADFSVCTLPGRMQSTH